MRYLYPITLAIFMMLFVVKDLRSQKKPYLDNLEAVTAAASAQLDTDVKEGVIYKLSQAYSIKGNYTYDITVGKNGTVVTVFAVERDGSIDGQNKLKDYLRTVKFNFKIPKETTYKFQYIITLK